MMFYVLQVQSNQEEAVRLKLTQKVQREGLDKLVGRIVAPAEKVRSVKSGVKRDTQRFFYPGYVFIEIEPEKEGKIPDRVWYMIRETNGIIGFVGASGTGPTQKPTAMTEMDQQKMLEVADRPEGEAQIRTEYKKGDRIKVTDGPFQNCEGEVEEILPEKGLVRVVTTIFGRSTALEVEYWQIERA